MNKHGGARPRSGPKPKPKAYDHASNAEKEAREEGLKGLKSGAKLSCPGYLTDPAKKEWRRIMRLYRQMESDILSDLDVTALVMYCEAVAMWQTAQKDWAKLQATVSTNPTAQAVIDKTIRTMNKQTEVISRLSEQLCLTPVGRIRMGMGLAAKKEKGADLKAILNLTDYGDEED